MTVQQINSLIAEVQPKVADINVVLNLKASQTFDQVFNKSLIAVPHPSLPTDIQKEIVKELNIINALFNKKIEELPKPGPSVTSGDSDNHIKNYSMLYPHFIPTSNLFLNLSPIWN